MSTCMMLLVSPLIFNKSRKPVVFFLVRMSVREGPAPLHNAHAHEEKYGWLARLVSYLTGCIYILYLYNHYLYHYNYISEFNVLMS